MHLNTQNTMRDIKLYALQASGELESKFRAFGYELQHSEIYRSFHELIAGGVLLHRNKPVEGAKFADREKAILYKKQVKVDLDHSKSLLRKALEDVYKGPVP